MLVSSSADDSWFLSESQQPSQAWRRHQRFSRWRLLGFKRSFVGRRAINSRRRENRRAVLSVVVLTSFRERLTGSADILVRQRVLARSILTLILKQAFFALRAQCGLDVRAPATKSHETARNTGLVRSYFV